MSRHGMVRAVDTHFEYEDGTIFHPFGTTIYALAHQTEELIETTFESLAKAPFNKVRMCVFPKRYSYNKNEPLYLPFEKRGDGTWNTEAPVAAFWDNLERIIKRLDDMEIECDLILFHGYDHWRLATMSQEDNLKYLDYVIKRLGHLKNIWWSLANEYDLVIKYKSMADWCEIEEFVASHDENHHLLSNHNCFKIWDIGRKNITHGSLQIKTLAKVGQYVKQYNKPVMVDECCYEGNIPDLWGNLTPQDMTARFWQAITEGGYCTHGETYLDENDVLWWAKGGVLKGESPARIAFLKELVDTFPTSMKPLPEEMQGFANLPDEVREEMEASPMHGSFLEALGQMPEVDREIMAAFEKKYAGCIGTDVFLFFYDTRNVGLANFRLPKEFEYKIEVIDTWNMTRETVMERASGYTRVPMPTRQYMAVLATKVNM